MITPSLSISAQPEMGTAANGYTSMSYVDANGGNQVWEVASKMPAMVAILYLVSAICGFIGLGLIYNLDKKTLAQMNEELEARKAAN